MKKIIFIFIFIVSFFIKAQSQTVYANQCNIITASKNVVNNAKFDVMVTGTAGEIFLYSLSADPVTGGTAIPLGWAQSMKNSSDPTKFYAFFPSKQIPVNGTYTLEVTQLLPASGQTAQTCTYPDFTVQDKICLIASHNLTGIEANTFNAGETFYFEVITPESELNDDFLLKAIPLSGNETRWQAKAGKYSILFGIQQTGIYLPVKLDKEGVYKLTAEIIPGPAVYMSDSCSSNYSVTIVKPPTPPTPSPSPVGTGKSIPSPGAWLGLIPTGGAIAPGLGLGFFTDKLVPFIISALFYLILSLSLIFLIVGGIMWIMSGGEKEALAKAKATVTWAIVALALSLSSFIILNIVGTFFGSNLLGP